jgi:branched-chain amino acid transport system substrate-binding protein
MILKRVAGSFLAIVLCLSVLPGLAIAAEYNVSQSVDFTGPYAVIMKPVDDTSKVLFQWWNDTKGKELGIKLIRKTYETRYDPTVVASLWPSILAGDKPNGFFSRVLPMRMSLRVS